MSKRTVQRVQFVMRGIAIAGWLTGIAALLLCMVELIPRETGAWIAGSGALAFMLGLLFGGCLA